MRRERHVAATRRSTELSLGEAFPLAADATEVSSKFADGTRDGPTIQLLQSGISDGKWTDSSGYGYDAVPNSGVAKHKGEKYTFDGKNGYMYIKDVFFQTQRIVNMNVTIVARTSYQGKHWYDNWGLLDFDRSEWFNVFIRGDDGKAQVCSAGTDGVKDGVIGTTALNDNKWHTINVVFVKLLDNTTTFTLAVDGKTQSVVHGLHPQGIGKSRVKRYGIIGDGSEATSQNGKRNGIYFQGDIKQVRMESTTAIV